MPDHWLISMNPPKKRVAPDPATVTQLHGPFDTRKAVDAKVGEIAAELGYPDDLLFAAFTIVDGTPVLILK
jgi:hypothetical protein